MFSLRVLKGDAKNPVNFYFALAGLMASFWLIGVIGYRNFHSPRLISWSSRLTYVAPVLIAFFNYLFAYYFPYRTFILSKRKAVVLVVATCLIFSITVFPDVLVYGHVQPQQRFRPEASLFWQSVFAVFYFTVNAYAFRNLFLKYSSADGIWRKRLKQVLIALFVGSILPTTVALLVPMFYDHRFEWTGAIFPLFLMIYLYHYVFRIRRRKIFKEEY
jgi:hypothetical protein